MFFGPRMLPFGFMSKVKGVTTALQYISIIGPKSMDTLVLSLFVSHPPGGGGALA